MKPISNPPPCFSHDVECLRGPCCPREVLLIVLRGFGPPSRDLSGFAGICRDLPDLVPTLFFNQNLHQLSQYQNVVQGPRKSKKVTSKTVPETTKNTKFPKHEMLPKPLYLPWFDHIQPPLGDTLGIKNALRRPHTHVPSNFH